ncbi:MAG: hypothetical protein V3U72_01235 [Candidatus Aenigmarchaeota archaeon]
MNKKGAIQLSLGFIVMIVFAVILLSLAIVWIRGMMESVTWLTEQQIASAEAELAEVFEQQQTVFALSRTRIDNPPAVRGKAYAIAIGFKNNLDSSKLASDNTAYFGADVSAIGGPSDTLSEYEGWIDCVPKSIWVEKGDIVGRILCSFTAPSVTDAGTYTYMFEGCTSPTEIIGGCAGHDKFGGAPLSLQIVIR